MVGSGCWTAGEAGASPELGDWGGFVVASKIVSRKLEKLFMSGAGLPFEATSRSIGAGDAVKETSKCNVGVLGASAGGAGCGVDDLGGGGVGPVGVDVVMFVGTSGGGIRQKNETLGASCMGGRIGGNGFASSDGG